MNLLIIVDVQNDFLTGGALAVPAGDEVIDVINSISDQFDLVAATQDWHPEEHKSFALNHTDKSIGEIIELEGLEQILWPTHCVQNSFGAEFAEDLISENWDHISQKGTQNHIDSYSGFFDNGKRNATDLLDWMKNYPIKKVFVVGLATDYCVKYTALDAARLGYETYLIEDACRAVNLQPEDEQQAIQEMQTAGVHVIDSELLAENL